MGQQGTKPATATVQIDEPHVRVTHPGEMDVSPGHLTGACRVRETSAKEAPDGAAPRARDRSHS